MKIKHYIKSIFLIFTALCIVSGKLYAETIWVVDRFTKELIRVDSDGAREVIELNDFKTPVDIRVDQRDGSVWVNDMTDFFDSQIMKLSSDGKELFRLSGFSVLGDAAIDQRDGSYYAVERMIGEVVKISRDGEELFRIKSLSPIDDLEGMGCLNKTEGCHADYDGMDVNLRGIDDIDVSPIDSSVLIADTGSKQLLKFTSKGKKISSIKDISEPESLAMGFDGSCWVSNIGGGKVFKVSKDNKKILGKVTGLNFPFEISVSPVDGTCWVATRRDLTQISRDGKKILKRVGGFMCPQGLSTINPVDGSFWFADFYGMEIIKISREGKVLKKIKGFKRPRFLEVHWY
ncbi:MAG TPA: hypothetical protein ENH41_05815 [Candidatus Omnitrophica bacterium]|nr:hypothetical protein [Candidatus Omnitrophota bacterium]